MRGLDDALARIARRDELRERASSTGTQRLETESAPSVNPVVDEVAEALRAVVQRNPGVFATVVVQEAETSWSVWIGEWDGTLHTRVTRLEPDPPATPTEPDLLDQPTRALAVPSAPSSFSPPSEPTVPMIPLPRRRPSRRPVPPRAALPAGPGTEASVSDLLPPRHPARDSASDRETPALGVRTPVARSEAVLALPGRSAPLEPGAPLPKRFPATGTPLPRRRPSVPMGLGPDEPALPGPAPLPPPRVPLAAATVPQIAPAAVPQPVPALVPSGSQPTALPTRPAPVPAPRVPLAAAGPAALPVAPEDTTWPPLAPSARHRPAHQAEPPAAPATAPALPVPTIAAPPLAAAQRVSGPAMNDRVAGRIADMLRREAKRDNRGLTS